MKESEREWFRPLWLRLLVTGLVAAWFGWEVLFGGDQLWMTITGAALAYAIWNLFIRFDARAGQPASKEAGAPDGRPEN